MSTTKPGYPKLEDILTYAPKMEASPTFPGLPAFPTFEQLVQESQTPEQKRSPGLFESLLNNPAVLYEDFLKNPEKYDPALEKLLMELATGNKKLKGLSPEETTLLDRSTLDYAQATPKPPARPSVPRPSIAESGAPKEEKPRPGIDVPVTELPAYWWV